MTMLMADTYRITEISNFINTLLYMRMNPTSSKRMGEGLARGLL